MKRKRVLPSGWKEIVIGKEFKTGSGGTPLSSKHEYYDGGIIPWINSGELDKSEILSTSNFITELGLKNSSAKLFPAGTVLVAMYGATAGKTSILRIDACTNQAICAILENPNYSNLFLKYNLDNLYDYLVRSSSGSARDNLSQEGISEMTLFFPDDKAEQEKLVKILSLLDKKISLNTCMNAELEAMAKQLYDYWFVQFDFPDENGRPYKSSGGKMVYNEKLKREIPAGWKVRFLGDALSFSNGINYEKGISGDKEYKIINVRNISSSSIFINKNELDVISLPSKQADSFLLNDDDIIIARSGTPGSTRLISDAHNIIYCGFIIKGKLFDSLYKYYILFLLKQLEGTQATKTGGSILQNVSQDTLKSLKLISPSKFILNLFNTRIQSFFSLLNKNQNEINHLTHLRDSLLPMLMNGQVSVE